MERATLEKAWAESYDFPQLDSIPKKVKVLSAQPATKLAEQVYAAAMELRAEGINWYGSDFEEELVEVINKGDAAISNPDKHISLMEYKEIVDLRENFEEEETNLDQTIEAAHERSDEAGRCETGKNERERDCVKE